MNLSDLLVVMGLLSGMYAILVALTGQRQFLVKAVNPHRWTWLIAGFSVFWVGITVMRWEAQSWAADVWLDLFGKLVSDAATPARVKIASLAILFSILLIILVVWCVIFFPRDPSTFANPKDRRAAFRYYIRLRGGLDFAMLSLGDGERLEEEVDRHGIEAWCMNLPKVKVGDDAPRIRTPEDQLEFWRQLASKLHTEMQSLDELISIVHQGRNCRLIFDCEYGGLYFCYLRLPNPGSKVDTSLYLFAATLNQTEVTSGRAEQHFELLRDAMHHIDRSIRLV